MEGVCDDLLPHEKGHKDLMRLTTTLQPSSACAIIVADNKHALTRDQGGLASLSVE